MGNVGEKIDFKDPQIRWNCEPAEVGDQCMEDTKIIYSFHIVYRNPKKILNQILEQAQTGEFSPSLEGGVILKGSLEGSVNEYLFASYEANRKIENLNFNFTKIPAFQDKNLSNSYKKDGNIEDYVLKLIE